MIMPLCQLPVLYVLSRSLQLFKQQWRQFLRLSWPYWLVTLSAHYFMPKEEYSVPQTILWGTLLMAITAWVTVRLHRQILLDSLENSSSSGIRELRMIGYWILMGTGLFFLLMGSVFVFFYFFEAWLTSFPIFILYLFFSLPCCWLFARWSLVIPAVAIDQEPRGLKMAWNLSKPYQTPLFILLGLLPYSLTVLFMVLIQWDVTGQWDLLFNAAMYFFWLYQVCVLSLTYHWIVQRSKIERFLDTPSSVTLVNK
ncbi:hypothetical protein [Vibrio cincinnatiensis]|uniref:hypothetical protein n=1 Tax=Vibrio cincinnatiensis TaxID=675 RepID=UPI001EDEA527|nr:hypothetical protein [Vibrio cincinnatiensis]MCG3731793.1 hypothetical protein [Vibrio cincinnatiensis]MCG3739489.1 hypothetical protein [Vibrio cincinnatiensis]MCG3742138.1 hypothetical protein [Vibrio cincinnatiensis]